eukprot:NODE_116_length_19003_cov_0.233707.p7 type:complete len:281 gc:universal NODE_116_length_19003_cov_0.233707:10267-11109(+)
MTLILHLIFYSLQIDICDFDRLAHLGTNSLFVSSTCDKSVWRPIGMQKVTVIFKKISDAVKHIASNSNDLKSERALARVHDLENVLSSPNGINGYCNVRIRKRSLPTANYQDPISQSKWICHQGAKVLGITSLVLLACAAATTPSFVKDIKKETKFVAALKPIVSEIRTEVREYCTVNPCHNGVPFLEPEAGEKPLYAIAQKYESHCLDIFNDFRNNIDNSACSWLNDQLRDAEANEQKSEDSKNQKITNLKIFYGVPILLAAVSMVLDKVAKHGYDTIE